MARSLLLRKTSRYKDTDLYRESDGSLVFGLYSTPEKIFERKMIPSRHVVAENDINALDNLALDYYGNEELWWVLALVNGIIDPEIDMYAGQELEIPARATVMQYVIQNGRGKVNEDE